MEDLALLGLQVYWVRPACQEFLGNRERKLLQLLELLDVGVLLAHLEIEVLWDHKDHPEIPDSQGSLVWMAHQERMVCQEYQENQLLSHRLSQRMYAQHVLLAPLDILEYLELKETRATVGNQANMDLLGKRPSLLRGIILLLENSICNAKPSSAHADYLRRAVLDRGDHRALQDLQVCRDKGGAKVQQANLVKKVTWVYLVFQDILVCEALQEYGVQLVNLGNKEYGACLEKREKMGFLEYLVQRDSRAHLDPLDWMENPAHQELQERREAKVFQGFLVSQDLRANMASKGEKETMDSQDLGDNQVHQEIQEKVVFQDRRELLGPWDHLVVLVSEESRARLDLQDYWDHKVIQEFQE
uniref:Uncharacterized protein n=1 Tax=Eptatretus burgeri TaxID=7764 RepID=A0A8C4N3H0_EPTBU